MRLRTHDAGRRSGDLAGFMSQREGFDSSARYHESPVRCAVGRPTPVTGARRPGRGRHSASEVTP